jgi:hypothetical protein
MNRLIAIALFAAALCACRPVPVCAPSATRCTGSLVEVCDADGQWSQAQDCAAVAGGDAPAWVCCAVPADEHGPGGCTCLPPDLACWPEGQ